MTFGYGMAAALAIAIALVATFAWLLARRTAAMRQSEERYARALQASNDGIWEWNPATDELFMSDRARQLCAVPEGVVVSTWTELKRLGGFHPEDVPRLEEVAAAHLQTRMQGFDLDYRVIHRDGDVRWVRSQGKAFPATKSRPALVTGALTDITERKRAEDALRSSEQRYALAMEAVSDGYTDWNLVTGEFYISPRLLRIIGHPPDATFADRNDWVRRFPFHPDDRKRWEAAIAAHFAGREAKLQMDLRIVTKGETRWVAFNFIATRDAAGNVVRWTGSIADINDAKRDVATVLDAIPGLVAILAPSGEVDAVNRQLIEYCGQPLEAMKEWGTNGTVHSDDLPRIAPLFMQAISKGEPYEFEARIRRFDGEYRSHEVRGLPFRDASGRIVRWYVLLTDTDARARAEEELRLSEERHALAMHASGEGHWDWKIATDEFYASPRYLELAGLPPDMQYSRRDDIVPRVPFHPDDRAPYEAAVAAHFAGETPRVDMVVRVVPHGEVRWLHVIGMCLRDADGKPVRWAGSVNDITARKAAEEALRLSQERYALAAAGSNDGIWDWDLLTDKMFVSERAQHIFGLEPGPTERLREEWHAMIEFHPADHQAQRRMVEEYLSGERAGNEGDWRVRGDDGGYRWIRIRSICLRNAAGEPIRMAGSVSDIDAQKTAEEALRLSEERYALAVDGASQGIFDWDLSTDQVFHSRRAQELLGLQGGESWRARSEWAAQIRYYPKDLPRMRAGIRRHLNGETPTCDMEYRVVPRDGEVRWLRQRGVLRRDTSGKAYRMAGSIEDVTERKVAAEALRRSEASLLEAQRLAQLGNFSWRVKEGAISWSEQIYRIFEFEPGSRITMERIAALVHPEDTPMLPDMVDQAQRGVHEFDYEHRIVMPDGRIKRVHVIAHQTQHEGEGLEYQGAVQDITERKTAEDALRESERRYERVMLAAEAGFWDWNVPADEFYVSPKLVEMTGFPIGTRFASRADFMARVPFHPDDRTKWERAVKELFASGGTRLSMEIRSTVNGANRWSFLSGMCVRDAAGKIMRWTGSATDITDRKKAEDELRESEARFRALARVSSEAFWEQDENLRYIASAADVGGAGWPTANRVGKTRWEMDGSPTPLSGSWLEHQAVLAARQPFRDFEYRRFRPDGELGYYSASGLPIFDGQGNFKGYYGVTKDITERKRAEQELRSRQEMLDLAQKSARAIAFEWSIGEGAGENRWSPELEAMYGLAPRTYDGSYAQWKALVHVEDWPVVKEALEHAQRTGDVSAEYRVVHPDASLHWLQAKGRMFFDAAGKPVRMVGFMQDVTERKHAEDEMQKLEAQLRRAQRLESMGTLAGGIAHDFNNILGAIIGYGEMALRSAKKDTRLRRDLDAIMAAGERGRALVDRILAFSRSGVGERVSVHVEAVVREALDQVAARLPEGVTIKPRLHAGRAAMLGDSTQVHQVVMNLASNAVQAMPLGGVLRVELWTASVDARPATVGSIARGNYIVLKVSDKGTGIPPDVLERMFDPFFTTKEVGVGTGLGLSLVHGIVTSVGGAIDVATELGNGSTFTVYLPRTGEAAEDTADDDRSLPRGDGQRVLIVDDEEPLVRLASETLTELGYTPVAFTSSTRALEAFDANPNHFDAILTDERMPGVTGSALIREVRRISPSIPIVLMSGFIGPAAAVNARELGANGVLQKPLLARDLAASLARVLHA